MRKVIEKFLFDILSGFVITIAVVGLIVIASYAWHFGQMALYKQEGYPVVVNNNFNMQDGLVAKKDD